MIEIIITTERISSDPDGRRFIEFINAGTKDLGIDNGILYYDFPSYADYEANIHRPDFLLLTESKGVLALKFATSPSLFKQAEISIPEIDETISEFASILIGRLLKSRKLRAGRGVLKFEITPVVFWPGYDGQTPDGLESDFISSYEALSQFLAGLEDQSLSESEFSEARSVIEGAKALARPQRRVIQDPDREVKAVALSKLENEIANFDERQRQTALSTVQGPQRIRGLAGSGKTVILAMKAAHLHMAHPDARILVTFFTRSLQSTLQNLITRFYRHYKDEEPDWTRVHVRHRWGGARRAGVYSEACKRHGLMPLSLSEARKSATDPFDYVCRELVRKTTIEPYYDFSLIDEGQDFPSGFYELCFVLSKNERDRKNIIWAYDELQNILNVKIRSPQELFGIDKDGQPRIDLERALRHLPTGVVNDIVLSKCYRNQREVLVTAHALGFGIYGEIVQLLQDEEHWRDVGYEVESGPIIIGEEVRIFRPAENSSVSIQSDDEERIIEYAYFESANEEVVWVVNCIKKFIQQGLAADDILIISLDDRYARGYFTSLSETLAGVEIETNNIIADPYREPDFLIEGKVTLSTVYRAKGNEAAVVFAIGVDAIDGRTRGGRNKLFTAFTRSKAWLRVSGVGRDAKNFCEEIQLAENNFPYLKFIMPDPQRIETIQRDLSERAVKAKRLREEYIKKLRALGMSEDEITEHLSAEQKP